MRFKLDENMPTDLALWLKSKGHDAMTVLEESLAGSPDPPLLKTSTEENRILLTFDLDFSDIRIYPPGSHAGIVVFRLRDHRWVCLRQRAEALFDVVEPDGLEKALTVVGEAHIRHRGAMTGANT